MPHSDRFMIDPSLLFLDSGLAWLSDPAVREGAVVSEAFYRALADGPTRLFSPFLEPDQADRYEAMRSDVHSFLEPIQKFSFNSVEAVDEIVRGVRDALLDTRDQDAPIFADEFIYLVTQSWLLSARHAVIDAFRRAGATIVEYGRRLGAQAIQAVVPEERIPAQLSAADWTRVGLKWIVYGSGTTVAAVLNPAAGGVVGVVGAPVIRAFDP